LSPQVHVVIGLAVAVGALGVGLWALGMARRGAGAERPLTVAVLVMVGLFLVEVLLGMELWLRSGIPGVSLRGLVHAGGPIAALIVALGLVAGEGRRTPGRYALAMLAIAGLALLSFAVRLLV
jgi:hypothetical protein